MNILLSYLEVDTLRAIGQDLEDGMVYEIDRHANRLTSSARKRGTIQRRIALVKAEIDHRRKGD